MSTYSVFLVGPVAGLADANAEALIADRFVRAWFAGQSALEVHVSAHLRSHRRQSQHVLSRQLRVLRHIGDAEGGDGKLEGSSGGLRGLLVAVRRVL
jgi:hypothetical protein